MKVSANWLGKYVDHGLSIDALGDTLTMSGLEVESVTSIGASLDGVVIGAVLDVAPHPNADRLTVCTVDVGEEAPLSIVCGAPNVAAGQRVPVATVGTTLELPDRDNPETRRPLKIKRTKLRGVVSDGMICAEDELGLSGDHSGIMVLSEEAPVGIPLAKFLARDGAMLHDHVIDISITPNRPDATSHIGVARDLAAVTGSRLTRPKPSLPPKRGQSKPSVSVEIRNPEACGRYVAVVVRGVQVGPSPTWLQQRLEAVGLRPRNNIVDLTNFVMYECGQPLHAFDLDNLALDKIVVSKTDAASTFVTLDDKGRILPAGTLMIRDGRRDVAIAGVMGGQNSEVSDATTNVLIESAHFDPITIRRTARALGLQTDASYRFERGVDPNGQMWAATRCAALMAEIAGGQVDPEAVDVCPNPASQPVLALRLPQIKRILGVDIPATRVTQILTALGFSVNRLNDDVLRCSVPSYRPDVTREIDVIEEVGRIYGFDEIPEPKVSMVPHRVPTVPAEFALRESAYNFLSGHGFREVYTNSLLSATVAEQFKGGAIFGPEMEGDVVMTVNAINTEMNALRPTMLPGLLPIVGHNLNHGQSQVRLFEIGHIFSRNDRPQNIIPGYAEIESVILLQAGMQHLGAWDSPPRSVDFFDLKGVVEAFLSEYGINAELREAAVPGRYDYGVALAVDGQPLGFAGSVSPDVCRHFDIEVPVFAAELDWTRVVSKGAHTLARKYVPIDRFPVVERDLATIVAESQRVGPMLASIREAGRPLVLDATVFDVYRGKGIGAHKKSVAFALRLGADRTLTDAEVDAQIRKVVAVLVDRFGAELRG